ncbi:MAG: DUF1460 domain-containing protein, partial [Marinilabiliales bacterium]|nr:DUF1460 domain-containing protein [Marinilabiliales bacterium]
YPQLIGNPAETARISAIEQKLSGHKFSYIPTEQFEYKEEMINDGDIVTLTTSIPGIDVLHVGILLHKEGRVHLLHASSTLAKVVVSDEPMVQILTQRKKANGVMIARPLEW